MFMLNGKSLPLDTPFIHEGVSYPANWLRLTTLEEKEAIGITEVADPAPYDDKFYWGVDNPKDEEMVRAVLATQLKQTAYALLSPTDYVDLRNLRDPTYKPEVMAQRDAIRAAYTSNAALLAAAATTADMAALQFTWPAEE